MASTAGATLLALTGVALTPSAALAINECGVGATVTCTPAGNPYPNGIFYIPATDFTINVDNGVIVDTSGSLNIGLFVLQAGPTESVTVNAGAGTLINTTDDGAFGALLATNAGAITADFDRITTSGANASGLFASSADGAVDVSVNSVITTGANATGVNANTNTGSVTIDAVSVRTDGVGAEGVVATSDTAPVIVRATTVRTLGAGSNGIRASSGFGAVTVTNTTLSTTGANAIGIQASSTSSTATVNSGSVTTTGSNATGILVNANRNGTGVVNSQSVSATGLGSQGITAYGANGVTVNAGVVTANGAAITASSLPLFAFGPPPQTGNVTVSTTGDISSATGTAIDASSARGSVLVTTAAGTTLTAGTIGINARSTGIGDGGIDGVTDGNVTVVSNGAIGTTGAAVGGNGVQAAITQPTSAGAISVTTASVYAGDNGIQVTNGGTGTSAVSTTGTVRGAADGVNLTSVGAFTVTAGGVVQGGANGIQATGVNGGVINVLAAGSVRGLGTGATTAVVDVTTTPGQTTTINNAGLIRSTNATVLGSAGDLAIRGTGGSVTVNNSGRIDGRMDFSGLAAGSSVLVNNTSATSWHTTGLTTFSAGNDTVANTGAGLLATSGATTFDFGADTGVAPRDVLTNSGRIVVGETAGASTFTLMGLERFNNSGLILLGSVDGTTSDGETNDRLVMSGTGIGTSFVGSGGSVVALDASLGATAQVNCAAATVADCISLPGGAVSGLTLIRVNNTNAGPGGMNSGIVLVDATGGSIAAGSLRLDPASSGYTTRGGAGALDTGLFFYTLVPQGAAQMALVSAPDSEAFEFVGLVQAGNQAWYTSTGVWFDRQADLRDGLEGNGQSGSGIWMKIVGAEAERDLIQTYSGPAGTFTFDTGYEQSTVALIGGVDLVRGGGDTSAWVFGASVGYVDSDVNFVDSQTMASMEGGLFGLYGSYVAGGLFLDATVNALKLDVAYSTPSLNNGALINEPASGELSSLGIQVEGGWRFALGQSAFIEPVAGVSYVSTTIDDLAVRGGVVSFDDATSMRANIGARIGTVVEMDTMKVQFTAIARAWNEFDGDGRTTLVNSGPDLIVDDQFEGMFTEVGGGFNVFSKDERVSAFLNASYRWNDEWTDTAVTLGARYRW